MIYNTATAGTSPNNVIPGYYYYDGTKWVRFINAQPSATISFSTADPNSGSPTFTPDTPQNNGYIYVSAINSSLWVWNGSTYVSYEAPSTTPFYLTGSTTDAGGNKTSDIYRTGSIGVGTSSPSKLLDVVNTASSYAGLIEAEGAVNNSYSRAMAIRMRRGTSASPTAIQLNDISAYGFAGHDGTSFSTTSAGMAGIATENWTSIAKGMGLVFSTTNNATSTLSERMRINHNGFVGISTINPVSLLSNTNTNINASNNMGISTQSLTWLHSGPGFVQAVYNADIVGHGLNVKVRGNTSTTTAFEVGQAASATTSSNPLFKVQGDGNVGIGTSSPNGGLTLYGSASIALPSTIHGLSGASKELVFGRAGLSNNFAAICGVENGQNGGGLSFIVKSSGSNNFPTNAIQAMVLDWNGNMGVGTSSPLGRLIVNDNSYIANIPASTAHIMDNTTYRPLARLQVTSGVNNNALSTYATTATFAMQAHNYSIGNPLNLSLQPIGGKVGIGSDQPIGQLANHATNYIGSIGSGVVGNNFSWSSALGGTMATLYNSGTQSNATTLLVGSAGTTSNTLIEASTGVNSSSVPTRNIFIIKGTGNIGIHKSAPTQQLHFGNSGNVTANKTYNGIADDGLSFIHYINTGTDNHNIFSRVADIVVASPTSSTAGTAVLRFLTSTNAEAGGNVGERMRIHGNGFIGIGTTSPTAQLHTNGSVRFEAAGTPGVGKVLTSDATGNATWQSTSVSTKTAAYTLAASDYGSIIIFNSSTNIDLIIPNTLSAGFNCQVIQQGTGKVTVVGASGSGVSVTSSIGPKTRTTGSIIGVLVTSATSVFLSGDTSN